MNLSEIESEMLRLSRLIDAGISALVRTSNEFAEAAAFVKGIQLGIAWGDQ